MDFASFGSHALRATAATNALDRGADLGKVQEWLGHANVSTTGFTTGAAPAPRTAHLPGDIWMMVLHNSVYTGWAQPLD